MDKMNSNNVRQGHIPDILRRILCGVLCLVMLGSNVTGALAAGNDPAQGESIVQEAQQSGVNEDVTEAAPPVETASSEPDTAETAASEAVGETTEAAVTEETEGTVTEATEGTVPETTEGTVPEATEETVPETTEETVPETTEETVPEETEEETVYTLYLTHVFCNSDGSSIQAAQAVTLTDADFVDGLCDISRFALNDDRVTVTEAMPASLDTFIDDQGDGWIIYAVSEGWKAEFPERSGAKRARARGIFTGDLDNVIFTPANVIQLKLACQYSNTGGLAGIYVADPQVIDLVMTKNESTGSYEGSWGELPTKEGFRIVLDPTDLNTYLVNPPAADATPDELKAALERGDFDGDIANHEIYYYQQTGNPDDMLNPNYQNRYSDEYNQAWNSARILISDSCTVEAVCGNTDAHPEGVEDHGANTLSMPRIKITLTEEQFQNARANGLPVTVFYRRNATWYTVNHWVPTAYLADADLDGKRQETVGDTTYVLLNAVPMQGRVGATTRAAAKASDDVYDAVYKQLSPKPFAQTKIESSGTAVNIYYQQASSYRIIFDTNYAFINRQQVDVGAFVDFSEEKVPDPERIGYTFGGWQYLKKGAAPDSSGQYAEDAFLSVPEEDGAYTLQITEAMIAGAQLRETDGVLALHLYPKWIPNTTTVRVILWTEDLTGLDDVQAFAEGGNTAYYDAKYDAYRSAPETHEPQLSQSDPYYSNVHSFTLDNVPTGFSLLAGGNAEALLDTIQQRVAQEFETAMGTVGGIHVADFYSQAAFEILHESDGYIDYSASTASSDGKTSIYVYFTRNIYTLKFHYYGTRNNYPYTVAINTNGYSFSEGEAVAGGELNFDYNETCHGHNNAWRNANVTDGSEMPVPQTITVKAKYGADLREVWPISQNESVTAPNTEGNDEPVRFVSWATTAGKYCADSYPGSGSSHEVEPTIMGVYAAMGSEIVADPANKDTVHHLVAYWYERPQICYYRYNHCYEVPDLEIPDTAVRVSIYNNDTTNPRNFLYLVPADDDAFVKYGFNDALKVSYEDGEITYNTADGQYYAVRSYNGKYYALARQVIALSSNAINKQNPSARLHLTRVNANADHSTEHADTVGGWRDGVWFQDPDNPQELYFYYDRDRYTITYIVSSEKGENTLGTIELPYGALVTKDKYGFKLNYTDQNTDYSAWDTAGYTGPVCPDRSESGTAQWRFKGWGLGPAGVNMQWAMPVDADIQGQSGDEFAIASDLQLYAIWERPSCTVTFYLHGGRVAGSTDAAVEEQVLANARYAPNPIPRPLRSNYVLKGWYEADENGNATDTPFNFDQPIFSDKKVAAVWELITDRKFSYTVYYLTQTPEEGLTETIEVAGKTYYVLGKDEYLNEPFVDNMVLNLAAKKFTGYVPQENLQIATPVESVEKDANQVYFHYTPYSTATHSVQYVLAGTETGDPDVIARYENVEADELIATPKSSAVKELMEKGYMLVNGPVDGKYSLVQDYNALQWIDPDGAVRSVETLKGDDLPAVVTYLVLPAEYTIEYRNADNSPAGADAALAQVHNPAKYTAAGCPFDVTNPGQTLEVDGKWYQFSHWSLGDGTKINGSTETRFPTLTVEKGTVGDLVFIANWKELETGQLQIRKTVDGNGAETDRLFQFTVTLTDADGNPLAETYGGTSLTDGKYTFHLKHGEETTITGIPAGTTYTVTETAVAGYTTTKSGDTGTIEKDTAAVATFTNTRDTGSLQITKTVSGKAGELSRMFSFTITLKDTNGQLVNETFDGIPFANGVYSVDLAHGEDAVFTGIPTGYTYAVAEAEENRDGYVTTKTSDTGTIEKDTAAIAAFTNTRKAGSLQITKTVTGDHAEPGEKFSFKVVLKDGNGNPLAETYQGDAIDNGERTFELADGESYTISGLPMGTQYTVTESASEKYDASSEHASGTIENEETVTAAFTNTRASGSLTVAKTVAGEFGETERPFRFTVTLTDAEGHEVSGNAGDTAFTGSFTFTLKDGERKVISGILTGTNYTVTEEAADGYTASHSGNANGQIRKEGVEVTFTNTRDTGDLTVTKQVEGLNADTGKYFSFTVTLKDATDQPVSGTFGDVAFTGGEATFQLKSGESKTITGIPTGTAYAVTETAAPGYTATKTGDTGTIEKDTAAVAAFTNTYSAAGTLALTGRKQITGRDFQQGDSFSFTVTPKDGGPVPAVNPVVVTPAAGTETAIDFGTLNFNLSHLNGAKEKTFTYEIAETAGNADSMVYDTAVREIRIEVTDNGDGTLTVTKAAPQEELVWVNRYEPKGSLTIAKNVVGGTAADSAKAFTFRVSLLSAEGAKLSGKFGDYIFDANGSADVPVKQGSPVTLTGIPAGTTYAVTEHSGDDFTTEYENETGTITTNGNAAVTVTNTRKVGSLTVSKTVGGNAGDQSKAFRFTVTLKDTDGQPVSGTFGDAVFTNGETTFQLKSGESKTITGIPTGMAYTVAEAEANQDGYATTVSDSGSGKITTAGSTVAFTNIKNEFGDLAVRKIVAGDAGETDKDFHFTVTLGDDTVTGTYGDMEFAGGTASFTLRHNQTKTAKNLPANITYTVTETEADQDDYTTTITDSGNGTIQNNKTATVVFTNAKDKPLPPPNTHVIVSKTVTGNAGEKDRDFHFTMTLSDTTINETLGDLTFTNGVANFTLRDGQSKTASQIPVGVTYEVTEQEANQDGYVTTAAGAKGTLAQDQIAVAAFNNERAHYGSLMVSKIVAGDGAETDKPFTFTVTLSDSTISTTYGGMTFTNGIATFTLKHGESRTASDLPAGITYTVTEADAEGYTSSAVGDQGIILKDQTAEAAFTNTKDQKGGLKVTNQVAGNAADQQKDFHFTVTLNEEARKAAITGVFGEMRFTDGTASFTLKHGESKTASGLPAGLSYQVKETDANTDGYTTISTGDEGTILEDQIAEAAFTNTKDQKGGLKVTNQVAGNAADRQKDFHFTVTLNEGIRKAAITGVFGEMRFTDGTASFTLKHGESKTALGLPAGLSYQVKETDANTDGYTTTATGDEGTILKDQTAEAAFTNTKGTDPTNPTDPDEDTGNLTVYKKVIGLRGEKKRDFTFVVTLEDKTISGSYGGMEFQDGRAEFTLRHDQSVTAEGLPAGIRYTVKEGDNEGYTVYKYNDTGLIAADKTVTVRFTNFKGAGSILDNQPKTGDETRLELWLTLMAVSFVGAITSALVSRRKKDRYGK